MIDLKEIKELHQKAFDYNTITRERAADDLVFYWVTQWDDTLLGDSQLAYRGEFNVIRKAGRKIMGDLRSNIVQVDFQPKAEAREDGADLVDGLYRADDRVNLSIEAYNNASGESIVCGNGAWELYTEYESTRTGNKNQVIRRRPVYESNNNAFWDPNAKRQDKSDADYISILEGYSHEGYEKFYEEMTGEECEGNVWSSFSFPEESYAFPWASSQNDLIYVTRFYCRKLVKDKVLTLEDPLGQPLMLLESQLEDIMDELMDSGYSINGDETKEIERYQVTMYIASGAEILNGEMGEDGERMGEVIAGEHIPVVPMYGERAFIEGEEHYEGVTRLAKDPQRLRNFQLSYLADIVSRSPRPKPIFFNEQLGRYKFMYEDNGADNNYPYYLQERLDPQGNPFPIGPVAQMPEQKVPDALINSITLSREAVGDVAPANVPQDIADVDLSGKAVTQLQNRLDEQSIVYQQNLKHAKRRDAEIYASMASVVYDAPREVNIVKPNGERQSVQIMESVQDRETGEIRVLNDITGDEFDVYAEIGPDYSTKKEQTFEQLGSMAEKTAAIDPAMSRMFLLKQAMLVDGIDMEDVREYSNKQLILGGYKEPETEEEMQLAAQAQGSKEPDAATLLAQAEIMKGQAAQMREQRQAQSDAAKAQNDQASTQIDAFSAETDRMKVQVDAQEAGANIDYKRMQTMGQRIENSAKVGDAFRARLTG